ncbi:MAG: LamG domain-containing protein [Candidatus Omnitrophica bacterium]|jgi:hypothetical protein|nr:LamG domain-containing protein [Candidatus Omnitrophota bacterium]
MALYLKWSDYSVGSAKRIVANMFSYLSPRWYPVNILGTPIYKMLFMSADQLSSASTEISDTYGDLDLDNVRTVPVGSSYTAKIYDNFGILLQTSKQNTQNYETFSSGSGLQDYRTNLKLLNEASIVASTQTGIDLVGQSYSGVAPYTIDRQKLGYDGWCLFVQTGSVVAIGNGFIISDKTLRRIGRVLPTDIPFSVGDKFKISYTKLGHNTKIYSRKQFYNSLDIEIFSTSADASFKASIEKNITRNFRADVASRFFYNTNYILSDASGSTYNSDYFEQKNAYLTNKIETTSGIEDNKNDITSSVINTSGLAFQTGSVLMDWTCLIKNGAYFDRYLRSYPISTIPNSVYYQQVSSDPISWMEEPETCGAHWIMLSSSSIWDVSGNKNNLQKSLSSNNPTFEIGRSFNRFALSMNLAKHGASSTMLYEGNTSQSVDSFNGLTAEFWINGMDKKAAAGTTSKVILKREAISSSNDSLTTNGYLITIDPIAGFFSYSAKEGATTVTASASISDYILEEARRYHNFSLTLNNNIVKFFIDGAYASSGSIGVNPHNILPSPTNLYIENSNTKDYNISTDEIMISSGSLTPDEIKNRFFQYAPRYLYPIEISSGSVDNYYQSKVSVYASGSGEFQYYDFAVKATNQRVFRKKDNSFYRLYKLPLEKI